MAVLQLYRVDLNHVHLLTQWFVVSDECLVQASVSLTTNHYFLEEGQLLEAATNDGFGVQTQPLLQQRGISATEVVVVVQVAFEQFLRRQGWVFPVQPALHGIADYKGDTARAVVCPRAVVMHAPAKLREQQDHHVGAGVVLLQVLVKRADGIRYILPQLRVFRHLGGVRIEAVLGGGGVQDLGAEAGQMHLGDVAHVLGHGIAIVLHRRGILLRCCAEDVRPAQGIRPRLRDVFPDETATELRRVHFGKQIQSLSALVRTLNTRQDTVGLQIAHGGDRYARRRQRPGETATKVYTGQDVLLVGIYITDGSAQPALGTHLVGLTGVPDIHRAEVGADRVGIAYTLNNGHVPLVPQLLDRRHVRVEPDGIINGQDPLRVYPHHWPVVQVERVAVGHDGIERVVAPRQLENHQHIVFFITHDLLLLKQRDTLGSRRLTGASVLPAGRSLRCRCAVPRLAVHSPTAYCECLRGVHNAPTA